MDRSRTGLAGLGTVALFVAIQLGALALLNPFTAAEYQVVDDPSDPTNSVIYVLAVLVATALMFAIVRYGPDWALRALVTAMSGLLSLYVFSVLIPRLDAVVGLHLLAWAAAAIVAIALYAYPEWYVIDATGVIIGAGAAALFGISFGPLPALLMLLILGIYDAISVYQTEHMLSLAESVSALKLPLVLVVPLSTDYSFREADGLPADGEDREREAFFIGLGDAVIPTVLVGSAAVFQPAADLGVPGVSMNLPALTAMVGTLAGLVGLLVLVSKGRAHAGLPLLNGGAIAGYLLGVIAAGIPLVEALGLAPYL